MFHCEHFSNSFAGTEVLLNVIIIISNSLLLGRSYS